MRQSQQVLEWQEEARKEGRQEGLRVSLLRALERRFQTPVPQDVAATLAATTDLELLTRWFDAALSADSLDAFRAAM